MFNINGFIKSSYMKFQAFISNPHVVDTTNSR